MELYCAKTEDNGRLTYLAKRKDAYNSVTTNYFPFAFVGTREQVKKKIKKVADEGAFVAFPLTEDEQKKLNDENDFRERMQMHSSLTVFGDERGIFLQFRVKNNKIDRELMQALKRAGVEVYKGKSGRTYARLNR